METTAEHSPDTTVPSPSFIRRYFDFIGHQWLVLIQTIQGVGAFALITLGVTVTKFSVSSRVIHPAIRQQIARAGVRLLPAIAFVGLALGLVIIGQTVAVATLVGAKQYIGIVMVSVVVRELGPLSAALLVLARVGTAIVIELGTKRAQGEVEALEALGIDPVHYLVVPRVIGLAISIFSLTIYLILTAILSGYLFAFLQDVPLTPGEYFRQVTSAITWQDFVLLAAKTCSFGAIIAVTTCYQGLARHLQIEEVAPATTSAVSHSVIACVLLDAVFIVVYLLM